MRPWNLLDEAFNASLKIIWESFSTKSHCFIVSSLLCFMCPTLLIKYIHTSHIIIPLYRVSSKQSETNRNSICFGCFSVCFAKQKTFFSVCFGVSDQYWNNRNKQNFVETNRKNLQKTFSIRGSSKQLIFFSPFEPKQTETQPVSVVFGLFRCFVPI